MKGFLIGVFATVLATLFGYLAIEGVKKFDAPQSQLKIVDFGPTFNFGVADAEKWQKDVKSLGIDSIDSNQRLSASLITVENTGTKALQNQKIVIRPKFEDKYSAGIVDFQNDAIPGVLNDDTKMRIENKVLNVEYKLLDVGEFHRFWVIHDRYAEINISARTPDLKMDSYTAKVYLKSDREDWSTFLFIGGLIASIASLVIGAIFSDRLHKSIIEAHSLDYKKFTKDGMELIKDKKNAAK